MKSALLLKKPGQAIVESIFGIIMFSLLFCFIATLCIYCFFQYNLITAAREGARIAATDMTFKDGNYAEVQSRVTTRVQNYFQSATGQTINAADIVVTPPAGAVIGQRNISVAVDYTFTNPSGAVELLQMLGVADTSAIEQFTLHSKASLRYEE